MPGTVSLAPSIRSVAALSHGRLPEAPVPLSDTDQ
jgi:hypothetical protein